jgi:hypothetical protein
MQVRLRPIRGLAALALVASLLTPLGATAQTVAPVMHAGEVLAVEGTTFEDGMLVSPPGSGTTGEWLYLVGPDGQKHPINLVPSSQVLDAAPPAAEDPIQSLTELFNACPQAELATPDLEGHFWLANNRLYVEHSGFAYQVEPLWLPVDEVEAYADSETIDTAHSLYPELEDTRNCQPTGAGTGPDAPDAPVCPPSTPLEITSEMAGQVVAVEGSSIVDGAYVPDDVEGTLDDTLYLITRNGTKHPLMVESANAMPDFAAPPDAGQQVRSAYEVLDLCPPPAPSSTLEGSFYLWGTGLYLVNKGVAYRLQVHYLTEDELATLPDGDPLSTLTEAVEFE